LTLSLKNEVYGKWVLSLLPYEHTAKYFAK
jgi:hypothetical protein